MLSPSQRILSLLPFLSLLQQHPPHRQHHRRRRVQQRRQLSLSLPGDELRLVLPPSPRRRQQIPFPISPHLRRPLYPVPIPRQTLQRPRRPRIPALRAPLHHLPIPISPPPPLRPPQPSLVPPFPPSRSPHPLRNLLPFPVLGSLCHSPCLAQRHDHRHRRRRTR